MIIKYKLLENVYPTIPCVHDCIIKQVKIEDGVLSFIFDEDITMHDSVKHINPKAKALTIRYHLIDDFEVAVRRIRKSFFGGNGFIIVDNSKLESMAKDRLEYLYHYIGYQSLIIKLWNRGEVLLDLSVDHIEYDWME